MKHVLAGLVTAAVLFGLLYAMCALYACSWSPCEWSKDARFWCAFMGLPVLGGGFLIGVGISLEFRK